ncbi:MAG: ADP-ribosylglycohydrolase family protein [Planctomycetota bacterium]
MNLARSLVREGGLDPIEARKILGVAPAETGEKESALLDACEDILGFVRNGAGNGFGGLDRVVPVAMAYRKAPEEGLRAAAVAASLERPGDVEMRAAGRALASVIMDALAEEPLPRREILRRASKAAGAQAVADEIDRVHGDDPFDAASVQPAVVLGSVLRAWYDSTSFDDALVRIGRNTGRVRGILVGALAGCTYGGHAIPREGRAGSRTFSGIDHLAANLMDLAEDGVLLAVREDASLSSSRTIAKESSPKEQELQTPPEPAITISVRSPTVSLPRKAAQPLTAADVPLIGPIRVPSVQVPTVEGVETGRPSR